jgi:hypothetical protein
MVVTYRPADGLPQESGLSATHGCGQASKDPFRLHQPARRPTIPANSATSNYVAHGSFYARLTLQNPKPAETQSLFTVKRARPSVSLELIGFIRSGSRKQKLYTLRYIKGAQA